MSKKRLSLKESISKQSQDMLITGQRFLKYDQLRQRHFWTSCYFAPDANGYIAAQTMGLFVTPSGQNGQGFPSGVALTDRETNWKSQNRVPDNQNIEITEIGVTVASLTQDVTSVSTNQPLLTSCSPRMLNQFLNNTIVQITYLTNSVPLGLAADFAQSSAPYGGSTILTSSTPSNYSRSNGFPAPGLRRRFKIPILLQHGEVFSFGLVNPRSYFIGVSGANGISPFVVRFDFWATESFVEKS